MNKGFRIALAPSIEEGTVGRYIAVVIGEQSSIQNMKIYNEESNVNIPLETPTVAHSANAAPAPS
jgi:hypothetical protein